MLRHLSLTKHIGNKGGKVKQETYWRQNPVEVFLMNSQSEEPTSAVSHGCSRRDLPSELLFLFCLQWLGKKKKLRSPSFVPQEQYRFHVSKCCASSFIYPSLLLLVCLIFIFIFVFLFFTRLSFHLSKRWAKQWRSVRALITGGFSLRSFIMS